MVGTAVREEGIRGGGGGCPASSGKEKTKCDRIAPSHPLSWPCVSDLLTPTSKARADYAP